MTEQTQNQKPTFDQMFTDLVGRINSYGVSFQTAIGLLAAVDNQIKMQLAEKVKEQSIVQNWEQHKENAKVANERAAEVPTVEAEAAN